MKVGLIGCGYWGKNLIRNFNSSESFQLVKVADLNPIRLEEVNALYSNLKTIKKTDELLNDHTIELVVIATPVNTHYELTKKALLHDKHVLVEKPMTESYDEAQELVALAKQKNLHLITDYTYLYSAEVNKIKELIEVKENDSIQQIFSSRLGNGIIREDVSEIWDLSSHDFAIVNYLLNERPVSVKATKVSLNGEPNKPKICLSIFYENKIEVYFECSWYSMKKKRLIEFHGTNWSIRFDDTSLQNKIVVEERSQETFPSYEKDEPLANLVSELYQVLKFGETSKSPARFDLEIIKVLEAAQCSLNQNGRLIQLNPLTVLQ
tara:strand:+ start:45 stop:1010 length:966 start_codon:yes stop_codon:yes gene_type:complete